MGRILGKAKSVAEERGFESGALPRQLEVIEANVIPYIVFELVSEVSSLSSRIWQNQRSTAKA